MSAAPRPARRSPGPVIRRQPGPGHAERGADVGPVERPYTLEVAGGARLVARGLGREPERQLGRQLPGERVVDRVDAACAASWLASGQLTSPWYQVVRQSAWSPAASSARVVAAWSSDPVTTRARARASRVSADSATAAGVPASPRTAADRAAVICAGSSVLSVVR